MKNNSKRPDILESLLLIISVLAIFGHDLFGKHSKTTGDVITILCTILAIGLFLYLFWFRSKKTTLAERILTTVSSAFLFCILMFVNVNRLSIFLILLLFWGLTVSLFIVFIRKNIMPSFLLTMELFLSTVIIISVSIRKCHFINGFFEYKFWYLSIVSGVILFALFLFLCSVIKPKKTPQPSKKQKHIKVYNPHKPYAKILTPIKNILVLLGLIFFCYHSLVTVNYALDTSKAEIQTVTVLDKKYQRSGRNRSGYRAIIVEYEGKRTWIYVSKDEYERYEEGDDFPLHFHEGALGEPYFT